MHHSDNFWAASLDCLSHSLWINGSSPLPMDLDELATHAVHDVCHSGAKNAIYAYHYLFSWFYQVDETCFHT